MTPEMFWNWFGLNAGSITQDPNNTILIGQLDDNVSAAWPQLAWEIGPDPSGDWYFALSPNLNKDFVALANEAIRSAPALTGWRFYSARQKKSWDYKFEIKSEGRAHFLNAEKWQFVLLQYPDGDTEIVLVANEASQLSPEGRWQAAAVVIEGLLGEECLIGLVDSFDLVPEIETRLSAKLKPISLLPEIVSLRSEQTNTAPTLAKGET